MPSTSDKQRRFMAAAAHNPKFARRAGIKQGVAQEFNRADTRKKYAYGGYAAGGLPTRHMVPPSPPRAGTPGMPPGGALTNMARQQQMQQRMRGRLPNRRPGGGRLMGQAPPRAPLQNFGPGPGVSGQRGPLGALRAPGGGMRPSGAGVPPPMPPQIPPGPPRGMIGPGPNVPPQGPNQGFRGGPGGPGGGMMARLQQMRSQLGGRGRYAKGGKVKRAVAALNRAREMLHDSDPDFDHIASLMSKDIPGAGALAAKIRKAANAKADETKNRSSWQAIEKDFQALKRKLKSKSDVTDPYAGLGSGDDKGYP